MVIADRKFGISHVIAGGFRLDLIKLILVTDFQLLADNALMLFTEDEIELLRCW